jgi:hypothetical protein
VSGILYVLGGITLALFLILPRITHAHPAALLTITGICCLWGASSVCLIDWGGVPSWLIQLSTALGLVVIAAAVASSGGAISPAWIWLFFVAVFAAYFFRRSVAIAYLLACAAVHSLPIVYEGRAVYHSFIAQLAIAGPVYLVLGGAIIAGKKLMWELQARAEQLAAEQVSLGRVATAVVGGESAERIYELVAREAAALISGGAAGILRLEHEGEAIVMGSWADHEGGRYEPGRTVAISSGGDVDQALRTNLEDRAKLKTQAATDPLTGLANHRTLQQRLTAEVVRAVRHDTPLSAAEALPGTLVLP